MKEEEKQRKFHESLLKMLYPPPSSPPSDQDDYDEEEGKRLIGRLDDIPEEDPENAEGHSSPSSSDKNEGENENSGNGKLTRAQRKRLRKRRLKEAASQRRKIIGPLLPGSSDDGSSGGVEVVDNEPEGVRQNAATTVSADQASYSKRNKLKQRRKSKKLAGEKLNSSSIDNTGTPHGQESDSGNKS